MGIGKKLYNWVLHWAETPYGVPALFLLALAESSFFPIPPDVLLIALALGLTRSSFRFAFICTVGSVIGGAIGYYIGWQLMESIGIPILEFYEVMNRFDWIAEKYRHYDAWAVGIAGFTPIPYKVFTIAAGASQINFTVFIITSFISRGARFFIVAGLIYFFGESIKNFIDKYFNLLTVVFTILLVGGFILIKLVLQ